MKRFTNSGQFKKGIKPWNTGLKTGIKTRGSSGMKMSERAKHKIRESLKFQWAMGLRKLPEGLTNKGNNHTQEAKDRMREAHKLMVGEKNPRWIVDRTKVKVSDRIINDPLRKEWTQAVKNRDGWKCRISNVTCSGKLEAHHILRWSKFPELRYETKNGITLCHFHHPKRREDEIKLSPYFQSLVASVG